MKMGTIIELPDGRRGTVVYNGLDGEGIKWGEIRLTEQDKEDINTGTGNTVPANLPDGFSLFAQALLRDPYPDADIECVGEKYEIIK